jgi:hypothetical protein
MALWSFSALACPDLKGVYHVTSTLEGVHKMVVEYNTEKGPFKMGKWIVKRPGMSCEENVVLYKKINGRCMATDSFTGEAFFEVLEFYETTFDSFIKFSFGPTIVTAIKKEKSLGCHDGENIRFPFSY